MTVTISRLAIAGASLLCLASALPVAVAAQPQTRGDIEALEMLANDGSFDAMLKLGLAYDLGTVVDTDRQRAFDWYLRAANAGHPSGQFNVAVMLDAGLVPGADDPQAALHWYTRAATNGQARAQYNLGLIYAQGDGVEANPTIARYWFAKAAEQLPAAKAKLASLPAYRPAADLSAPTQAVGALVEIERRIFAEMTWAAPPGPADSYFEVEILAWSPDLSRWTQPIYADRTDGSGLVAVLDVNADLFAWRVAMVDEVSHGTRASGWRLMGEGKQDLPVDTVFLSRNAKPDPYDLIIGVIKNGIDPVPAN